MISSSTLLHLRLPFSYFLLPVFLLAVVVSPQVNTQYFLIIFIVLHFFLYTASNGFNSYYDKDESSIGTLKTPPKVTADLLWISLALDTIAVLTALFVHPLFAVGCLIYGFASKAYSCNKIRLKRLPVISWLLTGAGVGAIAFFLVVLFINKPDWQYLFDQHYLIPAMLTGAFILGFYPLTQVYQHKEDLKRGDRSISMAVGIQGTFVLSAALLSLSLIGLGIYLYFLLTPRLLLLYILLQLPGIIYFIYWWRSVWLDEKQADFDHCLRMSLIATSGLNVFCVAAIIALNRINF